MKSNQENKLMPGYRLYLDEKYSWVLVSKSRTEKRIAPGTMALDEAIRIANFMIKNGLLKRS